MFVVKHTIWSALTEQQSAACCGRAERCNKGMFQYIWDVFIDFKIHSTTTLCDTHT